MNYDLSFAKRTARSRYTGNTAATSPGGQPARVGRAPEARAARGTTTAAVGGAHGLPVRVIQRNSRAVEIDACLEM